jgi:ATP-dependent DNA ligase
MGWPLCGIAKSLESPYLSRMFKAFEFCIPTIGTKVPAGPEWLHEIKYDGYRLRLERDGDRVRLITKGGYDWTKRYPRITEAARKVRQKRFVLDGEAVILGVDGISDFNALHSRKYFALNLRFPETAARWRRWPDAGGLYQQRKREHG